jgi:multidrug resistance efflux pump
MTLSTHTLELPAMRLVRSSLAARRLGRALIAILALAAAAMLFVPWQQSSRGTGTVSAFAPYERLATVDARISGRVVDVADGVYEGARVKKGDFLFRIEDNDPQYLERLKLQRASLEQKLEAARVKVGLYREQRELIGTYRDQTFASADALVEEMRAKIEALQRDLDAAIAYERQATQKYRSQKALADRGIKSGLEVLESETQSRAATLKREQAEKYLAGAARSLTSKELDRDRYRQEAEAKMSSISALVQEALGEVSLAEKELAELDTKISQFELSNEIASPADGIVHRILFNREFDFVKQDQPMLELIPDTDDLAVELNVSGIDVPLVTVGRPVRLQFEGLPAIQFSGWPGASMNVFDGQVAAVDPAQNVDGTLRVLVRPTSPDAWPDERYLRRGSRVNGWVMLDTVPLGYEVWRQMNGFPPNRASESTKKGKEDKPVKPNLPK